MRNSALIIAVAFAFCATGSVSMAEPKPFPDFTFKRVKVPTAGAGPRINVQIEPKAETPETTSEVGSAPTENAPGTADWFWAEVSPSLAASGPGRLAKALAALENGPAISQPRLVDLQNVISKYKTEILTATIGTKVSPAFVLSVIMAESSGNKDAESSAGAQGLMQLMPATAERFGATDATDPKENIKAGVAFLDFLMDRFDGDPVLVLAAYNAGENAISLYEGVPPYDETRGYVPKVLSAWRVARALCQTPPELVSDGCAFIQIGS